MKTFRILLSSFAVVIAVGAAFASKSVLAVDGYEFVPASGSQQAQCVKRAEDCELMGTRDCTFNSIVLRDSSNPTISCGNDLRRP